MSYTLALGPQHPAFGGPQQLVLQLTGELVADVEYRSGADPGLHSGRLARFELERALHAAGQIDERSGHAHTMAFCQAVESLCDLALPPRAAYLRVAVAEAERISSHLSALTALFTVIAMQRVTRQLGDLQRAAADLLAQLSDAAGAIDLCVPGGLRRDLSDPARSEALLAIKRLSRRLFQLTEAIIVERALLSRTVEVGSLPGEAASQFGISGPAARASGLRRDLRIDEPYAAYTALAPTLIAQEGGDVYARLVTLLLEAIESSKLVARALEDLPAGEVLGAMPSALIAGRSEGAVESPHGPLRYQISSDGKRISELQIVAPRQLDRLLARTLLNGAQLDNVAMIVRSIDPCTACAEC